MMTSLFLLNISYSGLTRPRPTEMTMSTTTYALRRIPKDYRIPRRSSYVPITNTDNSRQHKRCLYKSKIYPGLMIPCPTSRYRTPIPHRQENEEVYDQEDDTNSRENEEAEEKGEYDYPENQNQDEYEEENPLPQNADEEFENLAARVKCKQKNCNKNTKIEYENQENENQENENQENEYENEEENSQEESPDHKEEEHKPLPKPKLKPKPKPIPIPKGPNSKINALTVIHNYQPANFTMNKRKKNNLESYEDEDKEDIEEDDEENSQESRLEDVEEYNEGDDLQDDEYYYDDEEEYDQTPTKPKIPQKLVNIDSMSFKGEGDEPSESMYKNTVLKNVSKTNDLYKPHNSESAQVNSYDLTSQRPKPYDSAAEAYTRVKDKNKPQDQQVMQMAVHETTVSFNLVDEQKNKYKISTKTDSTTTSAKYRPRPTVRPNILKR